MRVIVFDIETRNFFEETGSNDPTSLDISIVCTYDSETQKYDSFLQEELPRLWPILERADALVGFNSDHFDIPLLNKYYPGDLTKIKSIDLLKDVRKALGRRIKLDTLAEATLKKNKTADGLQAGKFWKEGNIDALRAYCTEDVRITKELYEYTKKNGYLKYFEAGVAKKLPIDTSNWEIKESAPLTFSLPF